MFTSRLFMIVSALFLLVSAACVPTGQPEPAAQPPATETAVTNLPEALINHIWHLTAAGDEAADMFLPNPSAWLRFSPQSDPNGEGGFAFEGYSGCNTLFGNYDVSDDALTMNVGMTEQGCGPDLMAFETFLVETLRHQPTFDITSENDTTYLTIQIPDDPASRLLLAGTEVELDTTVHEKGCSEGGVAVFTPDDVRCLLANTDPTFVQIIDEDTAVRFTDPQSIADWVGGAIIYHIPTVSTIVLDRSGDVDPQFSHFSSRTGLAALSKFATDASLMADLKQQVQANWGTASTNEPEVRLSTAWQDGNTTIFLIAVAGLPATDERFYCASQTWTIGTEIIEVVSDCIAHEAGTPVNHVLFEYQKIEGDRERSVQVALNGESSNEVLVQEAEVATETAVYDTILRSLTHKFLIVHDETAAAETIPPQLETAVDPDLLQNFQAVNETSASLRFLFQNSNRYFVHASAGIERDYLPTTNGQSDCDAFRSNYPDLGGIITLSQIGTSKDGTQAMVYVRHECGSVDNVTAYYLLSHTDGSWQIMVDPING